MGLFGKLFGWMFGRRVTVPQAPPQPEAPPPQEEKAPAPRPQPAPHPPRKAAAPQPSRQAPPGRQAAPQRAAPAPSEGPPKAAPDRAAAPGTAVPPGRKPAPRPAPGAPAPAPALRRKRTPAPPPGVPSPPAEYENDPEHRKARRIARGMLSDLKEYHAQELKEAVLNGTFEQVFAEQLETLRDGYKKRVAPEVQAVFDYFGFAIETLKADIREGS